MRLAKLSWLLVLALLGSGCAAETPEPTITPADYRVCQFSQRSDSDFQGDSEQVTYALQKAQIALGVYLYRASAQVTSASTDKVFNPLIKRGCDLIVTTGETLGALAITSAVRHPNVRFLTVNYSSPRSLDDLKTPNNLHLISFDATGVGFLAGYTAASASQNGVIGVIAGIPSVRTRQYLNGFGAGVSKFNSTLTTVVRVLGSTGGEWRYLGTTFDAQKVSMTAAELVYQGADVLFVAAGPASRGVSAVANTEKPKLIFADSDWWFDPAAVDFRSQLLTSATVDLTTVIYQSVSSFAAGKFAEVPNRLVGNLSNDLTKLAPSHDQSLSSSLESELADLKAALVAAEKDQK
ncbi:MAG: hypothetical protein RL670_482 [Actinomycetota bacterium]|jgi:basic membrane protein A